MSRSRSAAVDPATETRGTPSARSFEASESPLRVGDLGRDDGTVDTSAFEFRVDRVEAVGGRDADIGRHVTDRVGKLVGETLANGGVLLFRALRDGDDGSDGALDELRRAYARGDIDDEEFDRRRERLDRD